MPDFVFGAAGDESQGRTGQRGDQAAQRHERGLRHRCLGQVITTRQWAGWSRDDVMDAVYRSKGRGKKTFGRAKISFETQQNTSPTLEIVAMRSDIGY